MLINLHALDELIKPGPYTRWLESEEVTEWCEKSKKELGDE